jgi:fluoride exporter
MASIPAGIRTWRSSVTYLLVAVFGAAGAVSRYAVDGWITDAARGQFPWGTFVINVAGAFALGLLVALTTERLLPHPNWRIAVGIGFLGSFTTFSTYAYESIKLAEDGAVGLALVNSVGMVALGLLAAFAGLALGRSL